MVIRNSIIYLVSAVISKATPFFLLPFLTKYLSVEEYGTLSIFLVVNMFYLAFIGMGMSMNVTKNYFKVERKELALIIGNLFFLLTSMACLFVLLTNVITVFYEQVFSVPVNYLMILPFMAVLLTINQIYLTLLRNEGRAITFLVFELSNAFLVFVGTWLLLTKFSHGWMSQVFANLVSSIILAFFAVAMMVNDGYVVLRLDLKIIKRILVLSVPLIPHVAGVVIINMSDRLFIENMVGVDSVGVYAIGYSIGMIVSVVSESIMKAWSPWFYKNIEDPTSTIKKKIVDFTYAYVFLLILVSFALYVGGLVVLPLLIDENFLGAVDYIFLIGLGYSIHGAYRVFHVFLVYVGKTKYLALSTLTASLINLILNYFFIDMFGVIGAVYATVISFIVSAFMVFKIQDKYLSMPWLYFLKQ